MQHLLDYAKRSCSIPATALLISTFLLTLHFATVIYVMALLRPSVCHVPELYWNGYTDLAVFLS